MMKFEEKPRLFDAAENPPELACRDKNILTRRDHFAMAALTGLCGNCDSTGMFSWTPEGVADFANRIADLMEAARNKDGAE